MSAIRIIIASALITAAAIRPGAAVAQPADSDANVSIVRTADLDLSTESGRRTLDHRLVIAARAACGSASDADLAGQNQVRNCVATVLAEARAKGDRLVNRDGEQVIASR